MTIWSISECLKPINIEVLDALGYLPYGRAVDVFVFLPLCSLPRFSQGHKE
jgi:hypothetical protein